MRLYLDEDLSPRIAEAVRRRGIDAVSAHEVGNDEEEDRDQLAFAATERRCLVTRNGQDFARLAHEAISTETPHRGIAICPQRYTGAEIGLIVRALVRLARRYPRGLGDYDVVYLD